MSAPATKKLTPPIVALGQPIAEFNENGYRNIGELNGVLESIDDSAAWVDGRAEDADSAVSDAQQAVNEAVNQVALAQQQVALAADQVQLAKDEVDNAQDVAANVAAQANFGGLWSNLFGAVSPPLSVRHGDGYWQLLVPLADVTTVEPGTDSDTWLTMAQTSLDIGQIAYSFSDLSATGLFVEPGMTYLQSAYPELFEIVGIGLGAFEKEAAWLGNQPPAAPIAIANVLAGNVGDEFILVGQRSQTTPLLAYVRNGTTFTDVPVNQPLLSKSLVGCKLVGLSEGCFAAYTVTLEARKLWIFKYSETLSKFEITYSQDIAGSISVMRYHEGTARLLVGGSSPEVAIHDFNPTTGSLSDLGVSLSPSRAQPMYSAAWFPDGSGFYASDYHSANRWTLVYYTLNGTTLTQTVVPVADAGSTVIQPTDFAVSDSGEYIARGSSGQPGAANGTFDIIRVDGSTFSEILTTRLGAGAYGTSVLVQPSGEYAYVYTSGSQRWRLFKQDSPETYSEVSVAASVRFTAVAIGRDLRYVYGICNTFPYISVIEPDFPFDPATEFYVPEVTPLTPPTIGTWAPSLQGKPYVRAK